MVHNWYFSVWCERANCIPLTSLMTTNWHSSSSHIKVMSRHSLKRRYQEDVQGLTWSKTEFQTPYWQWLTVVFSSIVKLFTVLVQRSMEGRWGWKRNLASDFWQAIQETIKIQNTRPLETYEVTQIVGIYFTHQCIAMKLTTAPANVILSRVDYSPWTIHDTEG